MKLTDVEQKLSDAKKKQAELKTQLAALDDKAAALREKYKASVEAGESETALDAMDAELYQIDRQRARFDIRFGQCEREVEELLTAREAAHREAERAAYVQDVQAALIEATDLEKIVQTLITVAAIHSERLDKMRRYAESVGVTQVNYDKKHLERRVTAIFHGGHAADKDYKKPYDEILRGNVEAVERQLNRSAPPSETIARQQELPTEQLAVN
jgi:hypothetical protein